MKVLFTFETISHALQFENVLKKNNISVKMMPTPRSFTTSCGICAVVSKEDEDRVKSLSIHVPFEKHEFFSKDETF